MPPADTTAKEIPLDSAPSHIGREAVGVLVTAAGIFFAASLVASQIGDGESALIGPLGQAVSRVLFNALGWTVYCFPLLLIRAGTQVFRGVWTPPTREGLAGAGMIVSCLIILFGLIGLQVDSLNPGGWLGGFLARVLTDLVGAVGVGLLVMSGMLVAAILLNGASLYERGRAAIADLRTRRPPRAPEVPPAAPLVRTREYNLPRPSEPRGESGPVIELREDSIVQSPSVQRSSSPQEVLPFVGSDDYRRPPLGLLDTPVQIGASIDEEALQRKSEVLEAKLANFGIEGRVVAVRPGPVITTFEIEPAPGVKVNRIVTLQDDLTMALRALGVRIQAPIPGKSVVGIEVANASREKVFLREILECPDFADEPSPLTVALGKDSAGKPVAADLARMPHLLMAGATGSGKSVALNAVIMSILAKSSPRDVRFVMIDPKMLELSLYEDLPHLLVPVVTDAKKAVVVLKNLVEEMERRYRLLKDKGVRNIDGYNRVINGQDEDDDASEYVIAEDAAEGSDGEAAPAAEPMPKIVVVIDELADLMMVSGKLAEEPITRLAQKARACGMHLIVATQRPSVDVITGLIKANFPSRISFQVTSRVDSRTILDQIGAERLLGSGDMLYLLPGTARVQRLHGAYVSESEIKKVATFIRRQGRPQYAMELLEGGDDEDGGGGMPDEDFEDDMYDMAVHVVTQSRQASVSWVQRRLRVGYNRAARMIERMEREGVVSASEGGRPREVLVPPIEE